MTPFQIERRKMMCIYMDKFPNASTRMLARIIYKEHPEFFNKFEHVRTMIREYRGSNGNYHRKAMRFTKYYKNV